VNDLVADVDGRPVFLERALDNLDGAHDACAESARLRQNDLHERLAGALLLRTRRAAVQALAYIAAGRS
jgi:hypothetical protein